MSEDEFDVRLEDSFSSGRLLSFDTILLANTEVADVDCDENGKNFSEVLGSDLATDDGNDVLISGAGTLSKCSGTG